MIAEICEVNRIGGMVQIILDDDSAIWSHSCDLEFLPEVGMTVEYYESANGTISEMIIGRDAEYGYEYGMVA